MKKYARKNWWFVLPVVLLMACGEEPVPANEIGPGDDMEGDGTMADPSPAKPFDVETGSIEQVVAEFKECKANSDAAHGCKDYPAKAICTIYGINDFMTGPGSYMDYDEIEANLTGDWQMVGMAGNQEAHNAAQNAANEGRAAFAIGKGNVAIIISGEQTKSSGWGVKCPNAASMFMSNPEGSFIGKTINYAWSDPADVKIYVRN